MFVIFVKEQNKCNFININKLIMDIQIITFERSSSKIDEINDQIINSELLSL